MGQLLSGIYVQYMPQKPFVIGPNDRYVISIFVFHPHPQHTLEGFIVSVALMVVIGIEDVCIMFNTCHVLFLPL